MMFQRLIASKIIKKGFSSTYSLCVFQIQNHHHQRRTTATSTIIQQIKKTVNPFSKLKISPINIDLSIKPYDLLDCPDGNKLRASVIGPLNASSIDSMIDIKINDKNIEISSSEILDNKCNNGYSCILEVPIKSDINVLNTKNNINIKDMHCDELKLISNGGNITTENLRSIDVLLHSKNGNIICNGLLLAQNIHIKTEENGNITLDKLQGTNVECKSCNGIINTNSCYVDNSKFITKNGSLILKNVHKNSEIFVEEKGCIKMIGVHGNINIKANIVNTMELQLDELYGKSSILINDSDSPIIINISDIIEKSCNLEIYSNDIQLDKSVEYLSNFLIKKGYFQYNLNSNFNDTNNSKKNKNMLFISTQGLLKLGKMSWVDNIKATMGIIK